MEKHIEKLTNLFQKLRDLGDESSEGWIVGMIFSSLPRSYDTLVTALESRPEQGLTVSLVHGKLLAEYSRRMEIGEKEDHSSDAVFVATHHKVTCFFCKKGGHIKRDCGKYKEWKLKNDKSDKSKAKPEKLNKVEQSHNEEFLFMVSIALVGS